MLIFCSLSQEHFQSKCSQERQQNINILMILHLLGIVGIVSVRKQVFEHLSEKNEVDRYRPTISIFLEVFIYHVF